MAVKYVTGIVERYWYGIGDRPTPYYITMGHRREARLERDISVSRQFETELLRDDQLGHHLIVSPKQLKTASVVEKMLALHKFICLVVKRGYYGKQPQHLLERDKEKLKSTKEKAVWMRGGITFVRLHSRGRRILRHYFDYSKSHYLGKRLSYKDALTIRRTYLVAKKMLFDGRKLTTDGLYTKISAGPRVVSPAGYMTMLQTIGVQPGQTMLDLHPELGSKALACAMLGIKYCTGQDTYFADALKQGFAEFVGLDHHYRQDTEKVDWVLSDFNMTKSDIGFALRHAGYARHLAAFVLTDDPQGLKEKYRAAAMIRLYLTPTLDDEKRIPSYLMVW